MDRKVERYIEIASWKRGGNHMYYMLETLMSLNLCTVRRATNWTTDSGCIWVWTER